MAAETDLGAEKSGISGSVIWGILLIISGVLATIMPLASSIGIAILLAWLIPFAAVWHLILIDLLQQIDELLRRAEV